MEKAEKHFVLVHGACHGAWCWFKLVTLLKAAGYKVTALDMAASGTHPTKVQDVRSLLDYFKPLMEFMASLPLDERVILVGHSMGGYGISTAMEMFPERVSIAVFCAAAMPSPELSMYAEVFQSIGSFVDSVYTFDNGPNKPPTSLLFGPEFMSSRLYQLSPPEDLTLALSLARPVPLYDDEGVASSGLTKGNYGSVLRVYILCDQDKVFSEDIQRWMIEMNPPAEVKVISGSDHMPMSSSPKEFLVCLEEIAKKFP